MGTFIQLKYSCPMLLSGLCLYFKSMILSPETEGFQQHV